VGKYYVISGELQTVLCGNHIACARQAACEAVLMNVGKQLAPLIVVNERGFDLHSHTENEDVILATIDILKESGLVTDE
jgi:hypothetical protein